MARSHPCSCTRSSPRQDDPCTEGFARTSPIAAPAQLQTLDQRPWAPLLRPQEVPPVWAPRLIGAMKQLIQQSGPESGRRRGSRHGLGLRPLRLGHRLLHRSWRLLRRWARAGAAAPYSAHVVPAVQACQVIVVVQVRQVAVVQVRQVAVVQVCQVAVVQVRQVAVVQVRQVAVVQARPVAAEPRKTTEREKETATAHAAVAMGESASAVGAVLVPPAAVAVAVVGPWQGRKNDTMMLCDSMILLSHVSQTDCLQHLRTPI